MNFRTLLAVLCACLFAPSAKPQTAGLSGRVIDPSGGVVPQTMVTVRGPGGTHKAQSGAGGMYSITGLAPGEYNLTAAAPSLSVAQPHALTLTAGANRYDIELQLVVETQQVAVDESASPAINTDPASNAGALVLRGNDLDALSDDPEDLVADLLALAGPATGPGGGSIFVDGFSGGQLPPKQSIREIRINSNPFTPEYDKLGYGRIEIFTRPGSDKFHGSVGYNLGTDIWNSRNPFAVAKAPFLLQETENSFSGPLTKRSSFTLDFERQAVDNGSVSNAVVLNPVSLQPEAFSSVLKTPQRHWLGGPHADFQIDQNNTLSVRYLYTRAAITDAGIGSFDLISRGYHQLITFQTAQAIETSVHGNTVNETRFQYFRSGLATDANNAAPEIQVLGSFTGGGASSPRGSETQSNYELQNYTSVLHGKHFWRFGARLRVQTDDSYSTANFNGAFVFAGGTGPQLDNQDRIVTDASGAPVLIQLSSIERYRRTLLFGQQARAFGGGPSQFSLTAGRPDLRVSQTDVAPFFGDDWRVRPSLTISTGMRYERQSNIGDWRAFAPRVAIAWAPAVAGRGPAKTVLRAGFGIFYDRFPLADTLIARRYSGNAQQQYLVTNPDFFPAIPSISAIASATTGQTIQQVDANLRSPYLMQSAITLERQLPARNTLSVTYTNSHGLHLLRSQDINAPLPGTGILPHPGQGPILLMASSGKYNQNQLIANLSSKVSPAVSLFGYYVINKAMSDTDGLNTYPGNPYNFAGEYGPAATDIRHRVMVGGTISLRWNIRLNPLFEMRTGAPFNITSGQDPYDTTLFTARPAIASGPLRPGLIGTSYGLLDPNPAPGEAVLPRNYGRGPAQIGLNLRIGKTWGFGRESGSGSGVASRDAKQPSGQGLGPPAGGRGLFTQPSTARRYNLTVAMSGRNILNHTNPGPITGNITSPLFGRANQIAGTPNGEGFLENASNRRLELQIRFTY